MRCMRLFSVLIIADLKVRISTASDCDLFLLAESLVFDLQFPKAVVLTRSDAETRKCAQKSAKELRKTWPPTG